MEPMRRYALFMKYSYTIYSCRERIYIVQIDARLSDILNESDPCSLQNLVTIIGGPMYRARFQQRGRVKPERRATYICKPTATIDDFKDNLLSFEICVPTIRNSFPFNRTREALDAQTRNTFCTYDFVLSAERVRESM